MKTIILSGSPRKNWNAGTDAYESWYKEQMARQLGGGPAKEAE